MRKFIAAFLFILVVPLAFAAIHYERQDFMGDTYFDQQIQAKRGIASSSSMSATTISTSGNATVGGTLGVTGATTMANVTSTGTVTAAGISTSGNATVGGTLGVTGATTMANVTSTGTVTAAGISTSGNATVGGTLGVTGATTMANVTSTGTVTAAGVNIGGGGAITMVKVASLDFLTSAAATVVPLAGVLPGDTVMAMPNSTATEPLISVVPSTDTLTFTWDGDNATTLTVGVVVLR